MPTEEEILEVLSMLAQVYGLEPHPRGFFIALADIPSEALWSGAEEIVRTQPWMPKPSQLRQACLDALARAEKRDYLAIEVSEMHYAFHHGRPEAYDPARLEQIAVLYEHSDRPYAAEHVRQRSRCMARALENVETAEQRQAKYQFSVDDLERWRRESREAEEIEPIEGLEP